MENYIVQYGLLQRLIWIVISSNMDFRLGHLDLKIQDTIYIEWFWRSFKQAEFYSNDYQDVKGLKRAIANYVDFYNHRRWDQSFDDLMLS